MNDTYDPTIGPESEVNAAVPADPMNAGEIPAEPAPEFTAAEGSAPVENPVPAASPDPAPAAPVQTYAPPAETAYQAQPAAPAYPVQQPAAPAYPTQQTAQPGYPVQPPAQPVYPTQPVYPPQQPVRSASPAGAESRPGKKSPYAPMSGIGMAIQLFLMSIPVIGLILSIIWACGVCRKIARRSLARAWLILLIVGILLVVAAAIVLRFCFADEITRVFEQVFPGYTIKWG